MANTQISTMLATTAVFALAACGGGGSSGGGGGGSSGGGGGGGGSSAVSNFQTLSVLPNGDGVARAVTSSGEQGLIYTPDVTTVIDSANAASSSDLTSVSASDFPIVSQIGFVRERQGTMVSDGFTFNIRSVEDTRTDEAAIVFIELPVGFNDVKVVSGTAYSNIPMGTYTYSGTQTSTVRNGLAPGSIGSFSMNANFGQQTFQYNGISGGVSVSGTGVLDTSNGRFATSNLNITSANATYGGTMHGLMHGSGATATSGVFHSNNSDPAYTGAFVGSR